LKKIAVLIQAHNNIESIISFSKRFKEINFYLHYDKKSIIDNNQLLKIASSNIFFIQERIDVHWGGFSQVRATLTLLEHAFSNPDNQYFHLISGDCLPLISFEEMSDIWDGYGDVACIEIMDRPDIYWRLNIKVPFSDKGNLRKPFFRCLNKFYKFLGSIYKFTCLPKKYYCYGSQWFSLKRSHVAIVLNDDNRDFINNFVNISCADEHVFQMISIKENFRTIGNQRFINFEKKSNSPSFLSLEQLNLAKSNNFWFARKVNIFNKERFERERN